MSSLEPTKHATAEAPSDHDAPSSRARPFVVGGVIVVFFAGMFALGVVPRMRKRAELLAGAAQGSAETEVPVVRAALPKRVPSAGQLSLPGSVEALQETTVYPRTSGYVRKWLVDIGDTVKVGQLLAEIDTPDLDQEQRQAEATLLQARAAVEQTKASLELAKSNAERYEQLVPAGIASRQDLDDRRAALRVAQANLRASDASVNSQLANVRRLVELKLFTKITAPFAGRVTSRTTEIGALVSAGNAAGTGLFKIAEVDTLRVFVHVPQSAVVAVKAGQDAQVMVREFPGRVFAGKVTRTAGALDPGARTLLTEVQIPNADGAVMPGMYAQVKLAIGAGGAGGEALRVPGSALIFGAAGPQVALVGDGDKIHLAGVQLGTDYGTEVEVLGGIAGSDRVVSNPSGGVVEGMQVSIAVAPAPSAAPAAGSAAAPK